MHVIKCVGLFAKFWDICNGLRKVPSSIINYSGKYGKISSACEVTPFVKNVVNRTIYFSK